MNSGMANTPSETADTVFTEGTLAEGFYQDDRDVPQAAAPTPNTLPTTVMPMNGNGQANGGVQEESMALSTPMNIDAVPLSGGPMIVPGALNVRQH
ncbi:hypothetical protein H310_15321, partial [Aphanomyces invadans]